MLSFTYFAAICLLMNPALGLDESRLARILEYDFDNIGTGPYRFRFESSDGISREEVGNLVDPNTEDASLVVRGSYSYTDAETGQVYTVQYTADENGFHPSGDHIKVPPFVPWDKHQHHDHGENVENDITATTKLYLPSTPKPPVSVPIRYVVPTTIRPDLSRFNVPTTFRPDFSNGPTRIHLNPVITTTESPILSQQSQGSTGNIVPSGSGGPNVIQFTDLDPKIQSTILKLITNGDARGLNIQAINSL